MNLGPAGPLGHLPDEVQPRRESHGRGRLRPPPRPLLLPTRRPARYHFRPTTTTQSLWELRSYGLRLLLVTRRIYLPGRMPSTTLLNCGSRIPSRVIRTPIWKREQYAEPTCHATIRHISIGRPSALPPDFLACYPSPKRPSLSQTSGSWRVKVDYVQPTTTSSYSSVTRHSCQQALTNPTLWGELLAC